MLENLSSLTEVVHSFIKTSVTTVGILQMRKKIEVGKRLQLHAKPAPLAVFTAENSTAEKSSASVSVLCVIITSFVLHKL